MASAAPCVFRLVEPEQLHWRCWDEWSVLYQASSGDTHLLNAAAVELLQSLQQTPASVEQLAAQWAALPRETMGPQELTTLLARLEELGLIEPVPL